MSCPGDFLALHSQRSLVRYELAEGGKAVADYQGNYRVLELQEEEEIRGLTSPGSGKGKGYILTRVSLGKAHAPKVLICGTLRL